jgi:hypothetical protein
MHHVERLGYEKRLDDTTDIIELRSLAIEVAATSGVTS